MRPFEKKLLKFSAYALILVVAAAIFMPVYACGCSRIAAPRSACLSKIKQQALGLLLYAGDNGDRFPNRDLWVDSIAPYVKQEANFHEFKAAPGVFGYAFNADLSAAKEGPTDESRPLIYDSANPTKNASDLLTSLPAPGKHEGRNNVGYADGHAKTLVIGAAP